MPNHRQRPGQTQDAGGDRTGDAISCVVMHLVLARSPTAGQGCSDVKWLMRDLWPVHVSSWMLGGKGRRTTGMLGLRSSGLVISQFHMKPRGWRLIFVCAVQVGG